MTLGRAKDTVIHSGRAGTEDALFSEATVGARQKCVYVSECGGTREIKLFIICGEKNDIITEGIKSQKNKNIAKYLEISRKKRGNVFINWQFVMYN